MCKLSDEQYETIVKSMADSIMRVFSEEAKNLREEAAGVDVGGHVTRCFEATKMALRGVTGSLYEAAGYPVPVITEMLDKTFEKVWKNAYNETIYKPIQNIQKSEAGGN